MVTPIPRPMLPHSASYKPFTGTGSWGDEQHGADTALKYVRFEPSSKLAEDKENKQRLLSALMFYDCRNSLPLNITFNQEDKITFSGREYTVAVVDPVYADKATPHHYELGLI